MIYVQPSSIQKMAVKSSASYASLLVYVLMLDDSLIGLNITIDQLFES